MAKSCPRCGNALSAQQFGAEQLDGCHECGGMWVRCDELTRLAHDSSVSLDDVVQTFRRILPDDALAGSMACPSCAAPLADYRFPKMPELPAHVCSPCSSVWLDAGCVGLIAARVSAARAHAPSPAPTRQEAPTAPQADAAPPEHAEVRASVGYLVSASCPACDAANPPASTRCWSCGAHLQTAGEGKRCPRCRVHLVALAEGDWHFCLCDACGGVWMEDGRLPILLGLEQDAFARVSNAVSALKAQAAERRAREEAERPVMVPHAVVHAEPATPPTQGTLSPPKAPAAVHDAQRGLFGRLFGRSAGHEHQAAVVSHGPQPAKTPLTESSAAEGQSVLRCPACRYEMHAHEFGSQEPVVASICAHCKAVWLDEGGVTAIYLQVQREGMLCARAGSSDIWARD